MIDHVKKYEFDSESPDYKSASAEIKDNVCEICGKQAYNGQQDGTGNLRYACLDHIKQVFDKMRGKK